MGVSSVINKGQITVDSTAAYARTVGVIESPLTINVGSGQQFTTLQAALEWIESRILLAEVTIQIADGTYTIPTNIELFHSNYNLVSIIGNQSTPANVVFNLSAGVVGIDVQGVLLRELSGMKMNNGNYGPRAGYCGGIRNLTDMVMDGQTYAGIMTYSNGVIRAENVTVTNISSYYGIWCYANSHMDITELTSTNNEYGLYAQTSSTIRLRGTKTLSGNTTDYNPTLNASENTDGCRIKDA